MEKKTYSEEELAYINKLMAGGMDRNRAEWYLHMGQTWTKEDYENYYKFYKEMLGIEDEEDSPK
jgi:hypothetical protein